MRREIPGVCLRIAIWLQTDPTVERTDRFAAGVVAGRAGYAAAGVRARAAEKELFYGYLAAAPAANGAHDKKLIAAHLAGMNAAFGQAECLFVIGR